MSAVAGGGATIEQVRGRNWTAITIATVLMMVSTFAYAAAFIDDEGERSGFRPEVAFVGLAIVPFVFVTLAFVSRNANGPKRVLQAMLLLLIIGLSIGLLDPLLGSATGFAAGAALTLNRPDVERVMRWRWGAVGFTSLYVLFLIVVAPPAGLFSAAVLPLMMVGFADEYAAWSAARNADDA